MKAGPLLETVIYADDIPAAQRFYEQVLGLSLFRAVENRFALFRCGEQMLLVFNPAVTSSQSLQDGPPPHGARGQGHVCFRATLAEQALWKAHLPAHGIAIEKEMRWPGGGHSFYVRDPAGNSVEFAEAKIWT
ncbi:MAG: VOC family protein [Rhizobiales bacterium]|nr:VOC family protein [Hyphomicrobiales bacterium]